jgi:NAD(P)H-dependent flavin oxidoreductase YrpB (nitropropane dioxygenase family)
MSNTKDWPIIIQGGMGVAVSGWRLANAVARTGHLGVISGSMLDTVVVRQLQDGDPGGHIRRAAAAFPIPGVADEIVGRYHRPRGRAPGERYHNLPMYKQRVSAARDRVTSFAGFVEVTLAKEQCSGPVGINLLTKVQLPNLASLYGAMLAGVDYVLMGAGIPREIPGVLDAFAEHRPARTRFDVAGPSSGDTDSLTFDPREHWPNPTFSLRRPRFLAIVSAASLAANLIRKATGSVDGFVIEAAAAGGHNAPPRGPLQLDDRGQPIYGERDRVDLDEMRALGVRFWLAGGSGSPEGLGAAIRAGARGIQVGTLFAYADESGIAPDIKRRVIAAVIAEEATIFTDPRASPTGYPFKVVEVPGRIDRPVARERVCDLGYLRVAARRSDGRIVYRCPAEPVDAYVAKGGDVADTIGRQCLCNGLTATIGLGQVRGGEREPAIVTSGDSLLDLGRFLAGRATYSAADVVEYLAGAGSRC